ncbi:hypothetical protein [Burkholderia phage BCSR52]|uniref:Uncharacterized protein n=1 Tax=Burkholderia phage BCSR52 TaxID=2805748 RepID=A0A889IRT2_9CAUD|nr:hypothetical protein [Burkholderia phage BCSR52]
MIRRSIIIEITCAIDFYRQEYRNEIGNRRRAALARMTVWVIGHDRELDGNDNRDRAGMKRSMSYRSVK